MLGFTWVNVYNEESNILNNQVLFYKKNRASKRNQKTEIMVGKKIINIRVHAYKVDNIKNRTISNVEGEIFKP